jgi:hypothetical protein
MFKDPKIANRLLIVFFITLISVAIGLYAGLTEGNEMSTMLRAKLILFSMIDVLTSILTVFFIFFLNLYYIIDKINNEFSNFIIWILFISKSIFIFLFTHFVINKNVDMDIFIIISLVFIPYAFVAELKKARFKLMERDIDNLSKKLERLEQANGIDNTSDNF